MTFSDFFDRLADLDWLAVLVGAIVLMILSTIWYGPLFGKQMSAATGMPLMKGMPPANKVVGAFITLFVLSAAVNYFGALDDIEHSLVLALVLAVLVVGPYIYSQVLWMNKKLKVALIELGFGFVGITLVSYVQGLMA